MTTRTAEDLGQEVIALRRQLHDANATLRRVRQECHNRRALSRTVYNESYIKGAFDAAQAIDDAAIVVSSQ